MIYLEGDCYRWFDFEIFEFLFNQIESYLHLPSEEQTAYLAQMIFSKRRFHEVPLLFDKKGVWNFSFF